jgi:hypothetical protein
MDQPGGSQTGSRSPGSAIPSHRRRSWAILGSCGTARGGGSGGQASSQGVFLWHRQGRGEGRGLPTEPKAWKLLSVIVKTCFLYVFQEKIIRFAKKKVFPKKLVLLKLHKLLNVILIFETENHLFFRLCFANLAKAFARVSD